MTAPDLPAYRQLARACKNVIARQSEARRKRRHKAGQMEMGL